MVDNVELNAGSGGDIVAADDDGVAKHQYVKVEFGPDNTQTKVTITEGLPIQNDGTDLKITLDSEAVVLGAGTAAFGKLSANSGVDIGDVDITSQIPGTGATNLGKAIGSVAGATDTGVMALAVRNDELADLASADGDNAPLQVTSIGALWVEDAPNEIDSTNSTTSTLLADAVFTGTGVDILHNAAVTVQIDASHDSATNGISIQFSTDNSNWDSITLFTYIAADGAALFQFGAHANFFRIVYTNGGTGQTHFRLQTLLHHDSPITNVHRVVDSAHPNEPATLVKAAIIAQAAGSGDFVPIQASAGGNLKVSVEEMSDGLDIGAGNAGAETQRVSISTDDVNLSAIKTAVEGTLTVSGTVTANAGTNLNTSALLTTTAHDAAFGTAGSADAQVRTVQGVASMTPLLVDATGQGDVPITLGGEAVVLGAGTAGIGKLTANNGVDIGDVDVTSISAGTNLIGDVGLSGARTSGGTTIFRSIDLDEGALEVVKASAGQIYWMHIMNLATAVRFVKIYNATSGTIGTGTPVLTFPIPTQGDSNGAGFTLSVPNGIAFSTGISIGASTGIADNDTGAPSANEVVVNLGFA